MIWLLTNWKIIAAIGIAAIIIGGYFYIRNDAYEDGYAAALVEITISDREGSETRTRVETKYIRMPKAEIQKQLEEKWCADCA
jgi:hypothetical protein